MSFFKRDIEVNFGESPKALPNVIKGLRISFKIDKTSRQEPNNMELKIYNLADSTRKALQSTKLFVSVTAGYVDKKDVIFAGDVRQISHERIGSDWVSKVFCGDGENAIRTARVDISTKPGAKVIDIIKKFMAAFEAKGVGTKSAAATAFDAVTSGKLTDYLNAFTLEGPAGKGFSDIMKALDLDHSIQNNELVITKKLTPIGPLILIDDTAGLVGSPAYGEDKPDPKTGVRRTFIKIKTLLQPRILPHNQVVLISKEHNNETIYVEKVTHTGDTHGQDWYTEMEGQQIK